MSGTPWLVNHTRRGRKLRRAHYYKLGSADALCGYGGFDPMNAPRDYPKCKHCLRVRDAKRGDRGR